MIWIIVVLYLAGIAPTWAITQTSSIVNQNDVIREKWLNSLIVIAWPIIGLFILPTLLKK